MSFIHEHIILPAGDIFTGNSVYKHLQFLKKSQWWSKEEILRYQDEKLQQLIKHAVETVPYYTDLFQSLNLKVEDIQTQKDLEKLPILTKEIIKREGTKAFTSTAFDSKDLKSMSSSGSTGAPLFYFTTKNAYSFNLAANLRGWSWMGFSPGDKFIKLSQNDRSNSLKKLQDKLSRNLYLATSPLVESNFEYILDQIEKYQPKVIRCYPDPLLFLARYRNKSGKYKYSPQAINTTGNTLYPEIRKEIEEAFGCKIFDAYASEGNSNVFECGVGDCYHSSQEYGVSEILDEQNNPISKGIGRLISTDLHNFAHPFLRYDTQDQVELLEDETCQCGRNLMRYKRILGRSNDVLTASDGNKFIVHDFTIFFSVDHKEVKKSIEHFQVVKTKKNEIKINLVVKDTFDEEASNYIKNYWEEKLGYPTEVCLHEEIPLTKSGKRKFIVNE